MARVLVVDDDATLAEVVAGYLSRAGHEVARVADGRRALDHVAGHAALGTAPDLIVLDLMLPEIDGLEVCRRVRTEYPDILIIILTALAEQDDRIAGLETGADDYLTKPFSPRELVLRVDSLLRRASRAAEVDRPAGPLHVGPLRLDPAARRASKDGAELALTVRELDLLAFLMAHPGVAFSRAELMARVWGWTFGDHSTVTVHVRRLREKIEDDPSSPRLIHTVWGVGYRLEAS